MDCHFMRSCFQSQKGLEFKTHVVQIEVQDNIEIHRAHFLGIEDNRDYREDDSHWNDFTLRGTKKKKEESKGRRTVLKAGNRGKTVDRE